MAIRLCAALISIALLAGATARAQDAQITPVDFALQSTATASIDD
jgi:hypothetical protein